MSELRQGGGRKGGIRGGPFLYIFKKAFYLVFQDMYEPLFLILKNNNNIIFVHYYSNLTSKKEKAEASSSQFRMKRSSWSFWGALHQLVPCINWCWWQDAETCGRCVGAQTSFLSIGFVMRILLRHTEMYEFLLYQDPLQKADKIWTNQRFRLI